MQDLEQALEKTLTRISLTRAQKERMKGTLMTEENKLKTALNTWAEQNSVRPVDFARALGYSPAYGWSLLRGQAEVTPEMFGRFVLAYGPEAADAVMKLAGLKFGSLPHPEGAQAVPVVEIAVVEPVETAD